MKFLYTSRYFDLFFNHFQEFCITQVKNSEKYRISGNFGTMEILALLVDDKNTPN